ncbi:MAG: DUF305 domain-containing protein [Candidatus Moraniibacteriota bacterium]
MQKQVIFSFAALMKSGVLILVLMIGVGIGGFALGKKIEERSSQTALDERDQQLKAVREALSENVRMSAQAKRSAPVIHDMSADNLAGFQGDAFDKAFLEMMISHHEGAIAMAQLIPTHAKHQELKELAEDIIAAQGKEMGMMRTWLQDWGYTVSDASPKQDHSMMH